MGITRAHPAAWPTVAPDAKVSSVIHAAGGNHLYTAKQEAEAAGRSHLTNNKQSTCQTSHNSTSFKEGTDQCPLMDSLMHMHLMTGTVKIAAVVSCACMGVANQMCSKRPEKEGCTAEDTRKTPQWKSKNHRESLKQNPPPPQARGRSLTF